MTELLNSTPQQLWATIEAHEEVAPRHFRLRLHAPSVAMTARAGQFVHILPRAAPLQTPLLRRAFSILRTQNESIEILYRVGGSGTAAMARWQCGEWVDVIGPLGQGFAEVPERAWLVGGGVGVPPLAMLASRKGQNCREMKAFIGARGRDEVVCLDDFTRATVNVQIATDDGSMGYRGRVTELLQLALESDNACGGTSLMRPTVFSCGPLPMLKAVAAICARFQIACQVSLEENMPCGVGVCNGCVVPVLTPQAGDEFGRYRRICVEGPVLWAHEVDWDAL